MAGVVFSLVEGLDPQAEFVVESRVRYSGIHGYHSSPLGKDLLHTGEEVSRTKLGVIPLLFAGIYANAFHPAYYTEARSTRETPFLIRRVELPRFQPRSWQQLLDSGEPLREGGVGITAGAVNDHFNTILRYYLPAFDQLGGREDLRRHLPLLEKLADFAQSPRALENSQLNMRRYSPPNPEKYVESVKKVEGEYRLQLASRLLEIRGWLALDQAERLPMYDWLQNLRKPEYVYHQIMDESDRKVLDDFLRQTEIRGHKRSTSWTNPRTRVRFGFALQGVTRSEKGSGYSTVLSVNLNPRLGLTHKTRYGGQCNPRFIADQKRGWVLVEK